VGAGGATPLRALIGDFVAVAAGEKHTCAIAAAGTDRVHCWGENSDGQLGLGDTMSPRWPTPVSGSGVPTTLSAGRRHSCASYSGSVRCWGWNAYGQVGAGTALTPIMTPTVVLGLSGSVATIGSGFWHECAAQAGGSLRCWGLNAYGQLGWAGGDSRTAMPVPGISAAVSVAGGWDHTCAVLASGVVYCWGESGLGQLGNGVSVGSNVPPTLVVGLTNATDVSCGNAVSCAVDSGIVYCWGDNSQGRTGAGTTLGSTTLPSRVLVGE
jgi:alpha-tubulin suppressor-like RCC1 family protein